ncbi:hypothetical protein A0H81_11398 [Grifola frondosa]|uniref:Uncharacterized protein n=1 Tax=Grifola frondosa TaxID=5627 RepID=A0A1C7LW72_GRIFR|nr:hypothetical protein A0H81_11398 [Grifola frondosa]
MQERRKLAQAPPISVEIAIMLTQDVDMANAQPGPRQYSSTPSFAMSPGTLSTGLALSLGTLHAVYSSHLESICFRSSQALQPPLL